MKTSYMWRGMLMGWVMIMLITLPNVSVFANRSGAYIQLAAAKKDEPKKDAPKKDDPKNDKSEPAEKKAPASQANARRAYQEALKFIEKKDWKKAIEQLNKAIKDDPTPDKDYDPYLYLGVAYLNSGDAASARKNYDLSKKYGVVPAAKLNELLAMINQLTQTTQPAKPAPTPVKATPKPPTATPKPPAPDATPTPQPTIVQQKAATPAPAKTPTPLVVVDVQTPATEPPPTPQARGVDLEGSVEEEQQPRGATYAVIIGLGTFQDTRIPPLQYTVNDAQGIYDVLTDPNYGGVPKDNITLLLDQDATAENIKRAIGTWLKRQAGANDTVMIYFAGHGAPEGEETYWVTYNADIDDLYATALSNKDISDMLARVESKRIITLLDSCYSAATVNRTNRTRSVSTTIPWDQFSGEGRVAISASDGSQLSLEMAEYQHGVFTYYLLEGLRGNADGFAGEGRDGMVEVEELWNFVRNKVAETAKQQGNKQTPVFQGSLTAGLPLTYDLNYLKELEAQRAQVVKEKQTKLKGLFEQGKISAQHFDCAFQMLEAGKSDGYLDGLLAGDISPETFSKLFECQM